MYEESMSQYLNDYYINKNKNVFIKYLSNFVTIKPNSKGNYKDPVVNVLLTVLKKIEDQDLSEVLKNLSKIQNNELYFNKLIGQAKHLVEFENIILKMKDD